MVTFRPISFTPAGRPTQTRYLPAGATQRPISYIPPEREPIQQSTRPAGLSRPEGATLTPDVIEARSQHVVNTRSAPYSHYIVMGGSWYGVRTVDGMETKERLNPANANTYPNPDYRYQTAGRGKPIFPEGSAGRSEIAASERPQAPGPGSSKAAITAYGEVLASWEREQMWRGVDPSMSYGDIQSSWDNIRFDVPTQERRAYDIRQSQLPTGTSERYTAITRAYQQQKGTILSSSGNLTPTATGYKYTTGEAFIPTGGPTIQAPPGATLGAMPSAELPGAKLGLIGMIARQKLGMDYLTGGSINKAVTQEKRLPTAPTTYANPFQGVPVLEQAAAAGRFMGAVLPGSSAAAQKAVTFGQDIFQNTPVLSGFYDTGVYVGLETKIENISRELNKSVPAFETKWGSKIQGGTFIGTTEEYSQYQKEYTSVKAQGDTLDALVSRQQGMKAQMFGGKTPSTEQMWTYPAYATARGIADWYAPTIAAPILKSFGETQQRYARTYPIESRVMFGVSGAAVSEPAEALAGVAALLPGAERLGRIAIQESQVIPALAGTGMYLQARGMYEGFTTQPAKTFVNLAYSAAFLHAGTRGAKFISPIGFDTVQVPTGRVMRSYDPVTGQRVETPVMTNIYGAYAKNPFAGMTIRPTDILKVRSPVHILDFRGTRALGGYISGRGLFAGSPVARFGETPIGSGYLPTTKAESAFVRPIMESRLAGRHLEIYPRALDSIELAMSKRINPQVLREYGTMKPKELSWQTWNRVLDYIEENRADIVAYGSTTQSVYLPRSRTTLGDIDLDIRPGVAETHSNAIYNIVRMDPGMRGIGPLIREQSQLTQARFVARHPTKGIILDLHPFWRAEWDVTGGIPTTARGIKVMPLYETIGGKIYFSTNYREIIPGRRAIIEFGEGRFKDPADMAVMFGNLAEMETARPLRWDINRLRFGSRQRLAQRYLDIGQAYERYTVDFVGEQYPEAIQYLREAGFPASRANIMGGGFADWDVRIGAITEFVKTDTRFALPEAYEYSKFFSIKPPKWSSPVWSASPVTRAAKGYSLSPEGTHFTGGYQPSPIGKYIEGKYTDYRPSPEGKYVAGGYRPSPFGKYTDYPARGKYPQKAPYLKPAGRYTPVGKYIEGPTYRPPGKYKPGGTYRPTTTKYPEGGTVTTYLAKLISPEYKTQPFFTSYKAPTKIESYLSKPPSQKPPKTPTRGPVFFPPETSMFVPIFGRRGLTLIEEKPKKKQGIRLAPDVLASAWNLESPIPRIRQAFGYNIGMPLAKSQHRNELAISNIQKSRIPTRYVWKAPFEQIRKINVPRVI